MEVTYRGAEKLDRLDLPKTSDPLEHIAWRWVRYWTHWYDKARKRPGSIPKVERIIEYMKTTNVTAWSFTLHSPAAPGMRGLCIRPRP